MDMQKVYPNCAGPDVHKRFVTACRLTVDVQRLTHPETRTYSTMTDDLEALASWLAEGKVSHVAMESTGVYWQPVYAVLETALSDEMHLLVVNARHMKNVPGKKTDMRDAEWIATLLRAGLLKGSFVPERDIRDLRQFTRYRKALIRDITSQKNRIEKLLQSQGFLLSSILSDSFGRSGLAIMHQLVQDGFMTEQSLDRCLKAQVRKKAHEILSSLNGTLSMPQRNLLKMQLAHLADLQANLREVEEEIHDGFSQFQGPIELLDSIPGIDQTAAYTILAEIGAEMSAFPTAQHICSWAGLAPGNYKSANKQKKQRLTPGNNYLKTMLCEVAWVIASHKKLYLSSWYWRLKQQTDAKRAIVALARKLLVIIYTMLKTDQLYNEQKFLDRKQASERRKVNRMVYELSRLGYAVSLPA